MPFNQIKEWIENEKLLGSSSPDRLILATAEKNAIPHTRIVAIREITDQSILFFTQKGTRKTKEISDNPVASATIWLALQQREIILDSRIDTLTDDENQYYWKTMPRERQLRFSAYAPVSCQKIDSVDLLNNKYTQLSIQYENEVPMSPYYCGYRLVPTNILFYTLGNGSFSEVIQFQLINKNWQSFQLSP